MTLCVRVSLIKPGGLSLISASYMVGRENQLLQVIHVHMCAVVPTHVSPSVNKHIE